MQTLERIDALRRLVAARRREGAKVALVPTMGNLHAGHLSLVRIARSHAGCVVASVFVNPLQFGPSEDYSRYPRTLNQDRRLLATEGVAAIFAPDVAEMYGDGSAEPTTVEVPGLSAILEGESRPGHFAGVATVVAKLFNIVQPDIAIFGEKDFQQLAVIRRMVRDLCLPVEVIGAPIVRDADGLALSSRNQYLSPEQRRIAPGLHRALEEARRRIVAGDHAWGPIETDACAALGREGFVPDYVAVRRVADLLPPAEADEAGELVVLGAARLGLTRLIDNVRVG